MEIRMEYKEVTQWRVEREGVTVARIRKDRIKSGNEGSYESPSKDRTNKRAEK